MGGLRVWVLFLLLAGCTRGGDKPAPPVVEITTTAPNVKVECPKFPDLHQPDMLDFQNKCFKAVQERETALQDLRKQIDYLKQENASLRQETEDWRQRYYSAGDCEE